MAEEKILAPEVEEGEAQQEKEESLADSVKVVSPGKLVAKRFFRSRLSMVGLITLIVLFLFSFVGPIFSPWEETGTDMSVPDEKRETYFKTAYTEQIDANIVFVNGLISKNSVALPGVEFDNKTLVGSYVDSESGETIYFKANLGANKGVYRCDEDGKILSYNCVEYTWDRKTFNHPATREVARFMCRSILLEDNGRRQHTRSPQSVLIRPGRAARDPGRGTLPC